MSEPLQFTKKERIAAFKRGLALLQQQTGVGIQIVTEGSDGGFELVTPVLGYVAIDGWQPPQLPTNGTAEDTPTP